MRTLLLFLSILFIATQLTAQTLQTNVRVAEDVKNSQVIPIRYNITLKDKAIKFDCLLKGQPDFELALVEQVSVVEQDGYKLFTYSTDDIDDIVLVYQSGELISVVIKQYNNVNLIYMYSEIKKPESKETTYRL